jgi:dephospho-CoA kinase
VFFVGISGAGKSTCVSHMEAKRVPSEYFGGIVVNETIRRYGKTTPAKEKLVREELRQKEGMAAVAVRIIPEIDKLLSQHDWVVADGLYSWSEYKLLKETYGKEGIVLAVAAPRDVRHQRLAVRPVRPMTDAEVSAREYAEIEHIEKGGPIANADYTLVNDGDPSELLLQLDNLLDSLGLTA